MRGFISCSAHVRKALDRLRKVLDRFVRVAVLDAVTHAVLDVPLENDLAAAVQRGFGRIDLRKNILARDVLVHHAVNGLHLTDDLFEPTVHVETVCLLSKLQSKEHIEIEVKMDELDLTSAESKATYEEIREYVFEHTGLKVSHLYIAQVKQKYGIIERENYNKPKSEDTRQPQCPPEKEKAITEALKHFGMI